MTITQTSLINKALKLLQDGELIAYATETVYALSADPYNAAAVEGVYRLKGRDANNPLSLLVANVEVAASVAVLDERARRLYQHYAPGPLTLVLPIKPGADIAENVMAGRNTIGIRIPSHPQAQEVLSLWGKPLVGTSVNPSGQRAACSAEEVRAYFAGRIPCILDGGVAEKGRGSTVIDLSGEPILLREGDIAFSDVLALLR